MFAIGHFGLGYLFGKATSKLMGTRLNLALLFTVSVLPDFDLLMFPFTKHRGPLHSLLFSLLVCLPFLVVYLKKAFPYFVALLSHSLIGDIFSGGSQLFWPFSTEWIFISNFYVRGVISVSMELVIFVVCTFVMVVNKDFQGLLFSETKRGHWLIPLGMVLGPLVTGTINPDYNLPLLLVVPSLFYIAIFSYLIIGLGQKKEYA